MTILVVFVEVTEYNLALIEHVYEQLPQHHFLYVFCSQSESGHQTARSLPDNSVVLRGSLFNKIDAIADLLKDDRADFAIINGYSEGILAWLICYCRWHRIPYAIESDTQLNIPANPVKRMLKQIYLRAIFCGNAYGFPGGTRQIELFRHYGMPDDHIFVMPMTVDTDRFREISEQHSREEYKDRLGLAGKKVILYVGRFTPVKNLPCLLDAAALLRREHDDFVVCLIGKGECKFALEKLTAELGLQDCVRFFDYQVMPQLAEYYSAADLFVLPSSFEQWGLTVNEALACRIPVIASDACGCVDDLIVPGKNGDVFKTGDSKSLSELLVHWLYSSNKRIVIDIISTWNYGYYIHNLQTALENIENDQV